MREARDLRIAVVGGGVAGLTAGYLLQTRHRITLFEKNDYPGGHTHTIVLPEGPDAGTPVDTGFIVMNHRNYPRFTQLLARLEVPLRDSDMSFSFADRATGLEYSGSGWSGLFAQPGNIVNPRFMRMLRDVFRFYRRAQRDLLRGLAPSLSLGDYLADGGYGPGFVEDHILPMGAAIWSTPASEMLGFPAASFLHFMRNHGLLSIRDRPQWRTVVGGSHRYVQRMLQDFNGEIRLNTPVAEVTRGASGVTVTPRDGAAESFDAVIIGAHADQALAMLADPSPEESRYLGAWNYTPNDTVLHTDATAMPRTPRAWASWNYIRESPARDATVVAVTYDMTRLQGLQTRQRYFVTLNRSEPTPDAAVIARMQYMHPSYDAAAVATQPELPRLNGVRRTWFCGSYFGYGFHEDAVRSGVNVAQDFGVSL